MVIEGKNNILIAECAYCGKETTYEMDEQETEMYYRYICYGKQLGLLQSLFPKIPTWIRACCIDECRFGVCPDCSPFKKKGVVKWKS